MGAGRGRLNWDRHEKPTRMDRLQEPTMSRDLAANGRRSLWPFQLPFQCLFKVSSKSLQMSLRMSPADHGPKPSRDIKHTAMFPYGRTAPARAARPARRNRELSKRSTLPSLADPPLSERSQREEGAGLPISRAPLMAADSLEQRVAR